MNDTVKLVIIDRSQAARLPEQCRFEGSEVYIRRDPATGDVVLSGRLGSWAGFFALDATTEVLADFMTEADRRQGEHARDPFDDIEP